jgi:hypothetical protein
MASNKHLRRRLPVNASRGQRNLAEILDKIFCSGGVAMTVIYEQPLAELADEDTVDMYQVNGMAVDFYVKELGMAIEYQGAQHYEDRANGFFSGQVGRDSRKRAFLQDCEITLVEIPYHIGDTFTEDDIRKRIGI